MCIKDKVSQFPIMHTALYGSVDLTEINKSTLRKQYILMICMCVVFMCFLLTSRNLELYCIFFNLQIYWYRQGGMDDRFKKLIYYNALCLALLCVCANIYFHGVLV
jgi:hypothetical protein